MGSLTELIAACVENQLRTARFANVFERSVGPIYVRLENGVDMPT